MLNINVDEDLSSVHRKHSRFKFLPNLSVPVSFDDDGKPLSTFGDWIWDLTPYDHFKRQTYIRFPFWNVKVPTQSQISLSIECRWLMFLVLQESKSKIIRPGTLQNYIQGINLMCKFALENKISVIDLLEKWEWLREFISTQSRRYLFRILNRLVGVVIRVGPSITGIIPVGATGRKTLQEVSSKYAAEGMQHPPVPYRVLSVLLSNLTELIQDFDRHSEQYFRLLRECDNDFLTGRSQSGQEKNVAKGRAKPGKVGESMDSLISRLGLKDYFKKYEITSDVMGVTVWIHTVQTAIKYLIHIYSGMRDTEVNSLPLECVENKTIAGKKHFIICGFTTKFSNDGPLKARWVTSIEGNQAILCGRKIASCIYSLMSTYSQDVSDAGFPRYLFIPVSYLRCASGRPPSGKYPMFGKFKGRRPIARFLPVIEAEDIRELEKIQPNRDWRGDVDFAIGERWPLTSHQCRRSLAIYAHKSGLVTLPSLRRQLKHITDAMSLFYAKGSNHATNFIGPNKKHFGAEWRDTEAISAAMSYEKHVLDSHEKQFGGYIHFLKHRLTDETGIIAIDREETRKKFKKGQLAYRETVLGGCTSTEHCEHASIEIFSSTCLEGCANLAGSVTKLRTLAKAQEKFVLSLAPDSLEYATEHRQLQIMEKVLISVEAS